MSRRCPVSCRYPAKLSEVLGPGEQRSHERPKLRGRHAVLHLRVRREGPIGPREEHDPGLALTRVFGVGSHALQTHLEARLGRARQLSGHLRRGRRGTPPRRTPTAQAPRRPDTGATRWPNPPGPPRCSSKKRSRDCVGLSSFATWSQSSSSIYADLRAARTRPAGYCSNSRTARTTWSPRTIVASEAERPFTSTCPRLRLRGLTTTRTGRPRRSASLSLTPAESPRSS